MSSADTAKQRQEEVPTLFGHPAGLFTLFFALLLIVSSLALGELSLYESERVIKDVGLATVTLFSVMIAIYLDDPESTPVRELRSAAGITVDAPDAVPEGTNEIHIPAGPYAKTTHCGSYDGLGDTWSDTLVAVVTEFGRTVRPNGTRGTDHGTATAAILLGGAVDGGRVLADWPGLGEADLYEGRDLQPTMDVRGLFKGVLADHLQIPDKVIELSVFPDSTSAPQVRNLIRT